jgi:hypothetical protein
MLANNWRYRTNGSRYISHAPARPTHASRRGSTQHEAPTKAAAAAPMPRPESILSGVACLLYLALCMRASVAQCRSQRSRFGLVVRSDHTSCCYPSWCDIPQRKGNMCHTRVYPTGRILPSCKIGLSRGCATPFVTRHSVADPKVTEGLDWCRSSRALRPARSCCHSGGEATLILCSSIDMATAPALDRSQR